MNYDFVSFRAQRLLISSSSMALVGTREYNWISFNWLPTRSCLEMTTRKNRGHDKSFPCTQTLNTELVHSVLNRPKMSPFKIDSTIFGENSNIFLLKIIVALPLWNTGKGTKSSFFSLSFRKAQPIDLCICLFCVMALGVWYTLAKPSLGAAAAMRLEQTS